MFSREFQPIPSFATIAGKGCPTQDIDPYQWFVVTRYFVGTMISAPRCVTPKYSAMLVMSIDH